MSCKLDADIIDLLTQNLGRLDEENEADRAGVYYTLSGYTFAVVYLRSLTLADVLENLASQASIAERIGHSGMMSWLLSRVQRKETRVSQNKQYTAEILAILLQSSVKNREKFIEMDGVDVLLRLLSVYRKRDPEKDSDEEEYVENLFDCLTCLVDEDAGKDKFLEGEGVELAQIMMREGKLSRQRALRVLDHALGGQGGAPVCERFVEAACLRTAFGLFMRKVSAVYIIPLHISRILTPYSKRTRRSSICSAYSPRFYACFPGDLRRASEPSRSSWRRTTRRSRGW